MGRLLIMPRHAHSHSHSHSHSHGGAAADGTQYHVKEEDNLVGAILFFAYIAAALVLTGIISMDLRRLSRNATAASTANAKDPAATTGSSKITFLALGAAVSFASLSYYMLRVLIQSYSAWTVTHGGVDTSMLYAGLFPFNILDYLQALSHSIWHWSTTSTLFGDFALAILNSAPRRIWTRMVIYYSVAWSMWMSDAGIQHHIPHLPLYFLLAQILPVSFTQNLFLLALELARSSPNHRKAPHAPSQTQPAFSGYVVVTLGAFMLIDRIDAYIAHSPYLTTIILMIRALLFVPLLLTYIPRIHPDANKPWTKTAVTSVLASVLVGLQLRTLQAVAALDWDFPRVAAALDEHPAVGAIGYDLGLAVASLATYGFLHIIEESKEGGGTVTDVPAPPSSGELQGMVDEKLKTGAQQGRAVGERQEGGGNSSLQENLDASLKAQTGTSD